MKTVEEKQGQSHWLGQSLRKYIIGAVFTMCLTVPGTLFAACNGATAGADCLAANPDDPTLCQDCADAACAECNGATATKQCLEAAYTVCIS